ncbi:MAG: hypothetical protein WBJ10_12070 [Daejeonella sp.]|uniref:hypothetical protein n=1 Tax=Daejeonella sp. TaxID=2805397 RepID=UPI003C76A7AE
MKKLATSLIAVTIFVMSSCEKQEVLPDKPQIKEKLKECRNCEGSWDLTKTNPEDDEG